MMISYRESRNQGLRFRIQIRDMFCVAKLILDLHFSSLAVARSPKQKTNHVLDIE